MPRQTAPQPLEFLGSPGAAGSRPTPDWRSLPDETQATLTGLMVPPSLDHAGGADGQPANERPGQVA